MDARNRNLGAWFVRIRTGQVQLPRFQRFEAWGSSEVADLLQTVIDELPAGAVLVLEIGDNPPFHHRPLSGAPEPSERMTELLLDGQQRLTALWRALVDDYPDRTFFVDMADVDADEDGRRDFRVIPQARWWRGGVLYPVWCDDPEKVLARNYIPLSLLAPEDERSWSTWVDTATGGEAEKRLKLTPLVLGLRARVSQFNLPFLALPVEASEAVVLNVFVKMNTRSVPLTAFDIIVARVEGETGESLHDLVSSLEGQVPGLSRYIAAPNLVLPAAALLQGQRPTQRQLVFLDFHRMIEEWSALVKGARLLVEFLEQERIPDGQRLPSEVVLAPLVALWAHAPDKPDQLGAVRTLLRSYLWRGFITTRYEFAAATASFQDFQQLLPVVRRGGGGVPDAEVFKLPLPGSDELRMAGWPKRRERLARAILVASFRGGARDIADGAEITPANAPYREYHHLFPIAYLSGKGLSEAAASVALNCALITWRTNRTIHAKPPVDYLRERAEAAALGEDQVRKRLASHAIPYEELKDCDFEGFLGRRAAIVADGFASLARGAEWPS